MKVLTSKIALGRLQGHHDCCLVRGRFESTAKPLHCVKIRSQQATLFKHSTSQHNCAINSYRHTIDSMNRFYTARDYCSFLKRRHSFAAAPWSDVTRLLQRPEARSSDCRSSLKQRHAFAPLK